MNSRTLHENGGIILTGADIAVLAGDDCFYSGDDFQYEYNILLGISYDDSEEVMLHCATIGLHQVEALADELEAFDANVTPPATIGPAEQIRYEEGANTHCLICHQHVTDGILFDPDTERSIGLHPTCTNDCVEALRSVWGYTDNMLGEEL